MTDPLDLIGKHIDEHSVSTFLEAHGGSHEVDAFDEYPGVNRFVTSPTSGVALSIDERGFIEVVFLYVNQEEKPEFAGCLPWGLSKDLTQVGVRHRLGTPSLERAHQVVPPLGAYGPADRYDLETYSVHLEYDVRGSELVQVTIMAASVVPGRSEEVSANLH